MYSSLIECFLNEPWPKCTIYAKVLQYIWISIWCMRSLCLSLEVFLHEMWRIDSYKSVWPNNLRKVRIPTSTDKVRIPFLHRTIPEVYRFSLCAEHKYKYFIYFVNKIEIQTIFFIFNTNPRFPPFLLFGCKSGVTFWRRSFRDVRTCPLFL